MFYAQCFLVYQKEINDFLYLRDCFEKKILLNEFDGASDVLKDIQSKYGVSHWLLDSLFMLKSLSSNEIEYVSFYRSFKEKNDKTTFKIIELFKEKNRISSTDTAFSETRTSILKNIDYLLAKNSEEYKSYKFYLNSLVQFNNITDIDYLIPLIKSLSYIPLIDKFLLFEKMISIMLVNKLIPLEKILLICKSLNNIFSLSFLSKTTFDLEKNELHYYIDKVNKLFFEEYYSECLSLCLSCLKKNPNYFSFICLAGKCYLILNEDIKRDTVLNKLIYSVKSLFIFDERKIDEIYFNSKLLSLFLNSTIFYDFNYIFEDCYDSKKSNVEYSFWMKNVYSKTYIYSFDEIYYRNILNKNRLSNEIQYRNNWGKCFLLTNDREKINLGAVSRKIKNALFEDVEDLNNYYNENINNLSDLNFVDKYTFIEIAKILLNKKESNLDIIGAISIYNDLYLESALAVKNIDCRYLNSEIMSVKNDIKYLESIDYILYSYITQINKILILNESMELTKYVINYIELMKIDIFDSRFIPQNLMERKKYLFMIYNICNVNWLKQYYLNKNREILKQAELYKKRLSLLYLIKDSDYLFNKEELDSEIDELIYSRDILFIKKNKNSGHVDLGTINLNEITKSEVLNVYKQIKNQNNALTNQTDNISKYYLLMEAFKKYREDFIRRMEVVIGHIRHNKFNNILDLLQKNDLYIRKSRNSSYSLKYISDIELEKKVISSFSTKVNEKIEFIRSVKLGPYDENINSKGLCLFIPYDIISAEFIKLKPESVNDLYDTFYRLLIDQLKSELERVKKEIVDYLREFFSIEFNKMYIELFRHDKLEDNMNKAKLELEEFYGNLKKWLSFSEESIKQNYSIDVFVADFIHACIDKGLNITYKKNNKRRNVNIRDISPYKLNMVLENFVSNAIKHSGIESHDLNVEIEFKKFDNKISFKFSNKISQDISNYEMETRLKLIKKAINNKERDNDKKSPFGNGYYTVVEILDEVVKDGWTLIPNYDKKNCIFSIYLELIIKGEEK